MSKTTETQEICAVYFGHEPIDEKTSTWKCICGVLRVNKPKTGNTNLFSHIKERHPNYKNECQKLSVVIDHDAESSTSGQSTSKSSSGTVTQKTLISLYDKKAINVFGWLEWIIEDALCLNFPEKPLTRKYTNLDKTTNQTVKKYMFKLVKEVEKKISVIANNIPSYALMFDGWTENSTHFIGLFLCCSGKRDDLPARTILLAFAPLLDETSLNAKSHKDFICATLSWYKIARDKCVCLIGDNCSVNKLVASLMNVPLLGCRSHRLNLAVEAYMHNNLKEQVEVVSKLMSKLSNLKNSGRLRLLTSLRPKNRNVTRWTSATLMFERYIKLTPTLHSMGDDIVEFLPDLKDNMKIKNQLPILKDLKSVTLELQKKEITLAETEVLFDYITEKFSDFPFENYLSNSAAIVFSPEFESAVIKIQNKNERSLNEMERDSVLKLRKSQEGMFFKHYYNQYFPVSHDFIVFL